MLKHEGDAKCNGTFRKINALAQIQISRISRAETKTENIVVYGWLGIVELPKIKELIQLLQRDLAELSFYTQQLIQAVPAMPSVTTEKLKTFADGMDHMPGMRMLTGQQTLWSILADYVEQAKSALAFVKESSVASSLVHIQQIDYARLGTTLANLPTSPYQSLINKMQGLKMPVASIHKMVFEATGLRPKPNGKYNLEKISKRGKMHVTGPLTRKEAEHLIILANTLCDLETLCQGLGKISEGNFVAGVLRVVSTLSSAHEGYLALSSVLQKDLGPSINVAILESTKLLRPLLNRVVGETEVLELRFGAGKDSLVSYLESACSQLKKIAYGAGDKQSHADEYWDAHIKSLAIERALLKKQQEQSLSLLTMINAAEPDFYDKANLRQLIQMRDLAASLPPSVSYQFIHETDQIIAKRLGLDNLKRQQTELQKKDVDQQNQIAKTEAVIAAAHYRITSLVHDQNELKRLFTNHRDESITHIPMTIDEIKFLHSLPPVSPPDLERFVELLYLDKPAAFELMEQKFQSLSELIEQQQNNVLAVEAKLAILMQARDEIRDKQKDCEDEINLMQRAISDPTINISFFEDVVERQPKPATGALLEGIPAFSRHLDEQILRADQRIAAVQTEKLTQERQDSKNQRTRKRRL